MTEILTSLDIERAAYLLRQGGVVAFPTETVYGLGAVIFNDEATSHLFRVKGRPGDNPLIAHIADLSDLETLVSAISKEAYCLIEAFFPGPLTLILPSHTRVPLQVRAGLPTVAVRMPSLQVARELIRLTGAPLVAPSANLSGKPSATTAQHVLDDLNGKIAGVIDGGSCHLGIESTVVSLCNQPIILRPGAITPQQIEDVLKFPVQLASQEKFSEDAPPSPGMKYRHYAPQGRMLLCFSKEELQFHLDQPTLKKRGVFSKFCAKDLYKILRQADSNQCEEIIIYCDGSMTKDLALMNRLLRAAQL